MLRRLNTGAYPFQGWMGACITLSAPVTAVNYSAETAIAVWDTELYDVGDWWTSSDKAKFTVPSDRIKYCRVQYSLNVVNILSGSQIYAYIRKSGAYIYGLQDCQATITTKLTQCGTTIVPVVKGDYFEVITKFNGDSSVDFNVNGTWYSIEAIY